MIPGFRSVTKSKPCPICGKPDWCVVSLDGAKVGCQRVESPTLFGKAGWLHKVKIDNPVLVQRYFPQQRPEINAEQIHQSHAAAITEQEVATLATSIGVSTQSLVELGVGSAKGWPPGTYSFPMRDAKGKAIGIRLRNMKGKKWAVLGSKSGLFFRLGTEWGDIVWCVEGPTSTAALLSIGFNAIGRPSNLSGRDHLVGLVKIIKPKVVVVVSENDGREDCSFCTDNLCQHCKPGEWGAYVTAASLEGLADHVLVLHPMVGKDVRDWIIGGATAATLMEQVNAQIRQSTEDAA